MFLVVFLDTVVKPRDDIERVFDPRRHCQTRIKPTSLTHKLTQVLL
nr:palindromic element RPE4 domain-containing protein [Rickettsia endosymbiont of Ixodes pacificus]